MSEVDGIGGLAALRSQLLSSDSEASSRYYTGRADNQAPQLPRLQTDVSARPGPQSSSTGQRTSGASTSSLSAQSGPSTAFTSPNASLDAKVAQSWNDQHRNSAGSSSRASNSAFAYADQLGSPSTKMNGNMGEIGEKMAGALDGAGSPNEKDKSGKKSNPLQDLIVTETAYVSELSKIIRKVASAWSRNNFPPPELDTMFRNVESIYRVNRTFLKSLKEIGPNPSSPRALGDLLMRWIDDLETPYMRYCENYFTDFDTWPAVQGNPRLHELLAEMSAPTDADGAPVVFSDRKRQPGDVWTMDALFGLPQVRLKYYKKLYARLLKSTHPGKSDHRLLVGANEKLDELMEKAKNRISMSILDDSPLAARERGSASSGSGNANRSTENTIDQLVQKLDLNSPSSGKGFDSPVPGSQTPGSELALSPVTPGKPVQAPPLIPPMAPVSPISPVPPSNAGFDPSSADELERTLDVSRVLDLFTMKPKKCQLRINPPTLPFKRELRKNADVVIDFTPLSTGEERIWRRGHIFLLSDLFLICDRMTPAERTERNLGPQGMWLLFPPLAGKHLKVAEAGGPGNALSITILKKETIKVHVQSPEEKDAWIRAFDDCNQFAASMGAQQLKPNGSSQPPRPAAASAPSGPSSEPSPAINITQPGDRALGDRSPAFSPHSSVGSSITRQGSFTSVSSFPKIKGSAFPDQGANGSESLQAPAGFMNGSRSASPAPMNGPPQPNGDGSYGRPGPSMPGPPRPTQPRPSNVPIPPRGMAASPSPLSPGPNAGAGGRPPFGAPRPGALMNGGPPPGAPNGRPPYPQPGGTWNTNGNYGNARPPPPPPPGGPDYLPSPGRPRDPMRRPSAPNLRDQRGDSSTPPSRTRSVSSMGSNGAPKLPSEMLKDGDLKSHTPRYTPPSSPTLKPSGPTTSTIAAQMRCRLYLKQSHAQWKSLGNARLKLYHIMPINDKQLVVENDRKTLVSTIILPDGVERVGKVGVAVEISDKGNRTGIIYMLQMRSEESAQGLFGELIDGSGRTVAIA